ncbi:hypothetical protein O181_019419 [Austropuccinia psidii MF-1]|uniref:DUF4211 domain-containing protein n=1 Tax=Austropuccinia psidii MF-1 TaxID=1389203 RepID=A0A9Q3C9G9_9BASI|nr:hypothetical protein [Austropuccinia psidii MF-1]
MPDIKSSIRAQSFSVLVRSRPDLNFFKPPNGRIYDCPFTDSIQPIVISSPPSPQKFHKPSKKPAKPIKKKKKHSPKPAKISKSLKHKKRRKQQKILENSEDEDDLFLSDYSEPETKLRERDSAARSKFAIIRKARKQMSKKAIIKKEVNSRRILPDSEDEDQKLPSSETDSYSSSETESETESETDEEERKRQEEEFIIDDMATTDQKAKIMKQVRKIMPAQFTATKRENLDHFKIACEFIILHLILPQLDWRKKRQIFHDSCKHLEDFFQSRALSFLDSPAWIARFKSELDSRPFVAEIIHTKGGTGCSACNNRTKASKKIVKLYGPKYNSLTLKEIVAPSESSSSGDDDSIDSYSDVSTLDGRKTQATLEGHIKDTGNAIEFVCGQDCASKAVNYHYFKHWKLYHLRILKGEVEKHWPKKLFKPKDPLPDSKELKQIKRDAGRLCLQQGKLN